MPPLSVTKKRKQQVGRLQQAWDSLLDQQQEEGNGKSTDTVLFCDDGCLPVHGALLAEMSPLVKAAFFSQGTDYLQYRTVIMAGFKVAEIKLLVQFIYAGFVNTDSLDDLDVLKNLLSYFQVPISAVNYSSTKDPDERSILYYSDGQKTTDDADVGDGEVTQDMESSSSSSKSSPSEGETMRFEKEEPATSSADENVPLVDLRKKKTNVTAGSSKKPTATTVSTSEGPKSLSSATIIQLQRLAHPKTNGKEAGSNQLPIPRTTPTRKPIRQKDMEIHKGKSDEIDKGPEKKIPETPNKNTSTRPRRTARQTLREDFIPDDEEDGDEEEISENDDGDDDEEFIPSPPSTMTLRNRKSRRVTYRDSDDVESVASESSHSSQRTNVRTPGFGNGRKAPHKVSVTKSPNGKPTGGKQCSPASSSPHPETPSVSSNAKKQKVHHHETCSTNESPKEGELLITKSKGGQEVTFKLSY